MIVIPDQSTTITMSVTIYLGEVSFVLQEVEESKLRVMKIQDNAGSINIEPVSSNVLIIE